MATQPRTLFQSVRLAAWFRRPAGMGLAVIYSALACGSPSAGEGAAEKDSPAAPSPAGGLPAATPAGGGSGPTEQTAELGEPHAGQYHLGPVDFAESEWHNACAPGAGYRAELRAATGLGGEYLAGLANEYAQAGGTCDACIVIRTATERSIVARVVTYGVENAAGDIDVSRAVYAELNTGEYPRSMTWQFAKCPDTGPLQYEFQTEANVWWTSLWVRNPRAAVTKVEVKSANHSAFFELRRESDGTLNDDTGFGEGPFTLRITALDGQVVEETLPGFSPGQLITSSQQFE